MIAAYDNELEHPEAIPAPENENHKSNVLSVDRLRSIIERHERLTEEIKLLREDQRDILKEAASAGYDKKVLLQVIRIRATDPKEWEEYQAVLDVYLRALGA